MFKLALSLLLLIGLSSPTHAAAFRAPDWAENANIYEVNIRQYTPEGTINAFAKHLPRLEKMGVRILWIMPVQPIGSLNRKGELGSYYAIRDYTAVNPAFGTLADFRALVRLAHRHHMRVILDWVANHTAWDNGWVSAHPDWYKKDAAGKIGPYTYDNGTALEYWDDVVGLDYGNRALWPAMIDAMQFWLHETGIDGFRCDVAGLVPVEFWVEARTRLDSNAPHFWLAEGDRLDLTQAFDMTYDWALYQRMVDVAHGKSNAASLGELLVHPTKTYPPGKFQMRFTSNHDENSWKGSDRELYGDGFAAFAVIAATAPGMPLIYGGQEAGLGKRLAFFKRDPLDWSALPHAALYARLLALRSNHPALRGGNDGAPIELLSTGNDDVLAYVRRRDGHAVMVIANLSGRAQNFAIAGKTQALAAWGYQLSDD